MKRRTFFKTLGAAGMAAAAGAMPAAASAAPVQELATLFDLSRCIGCGACVEACREANADRYPEPKKPFPPMLPPRVKAEDFSDRRDVDDRLTPYNWLYIQSAVVQYNGREVEVNVPRRCMHCQNPPCAALCPWGAAHRLKNGVVSIDSEICLGGAKCRSVCPWSIPQRQTGVGLYLDLLPRYAGNGVMYKCDRCLARLEQGGAPACIEACPENAQTIGPRDEIVAKAHALAREMNGFIYGEHENGGTNTIYVSPVPFELLNQAVETGKGRPHLGPVKDVMGSDDNLVKAALAAPVAGVAAAFLKVRAGMRSEGEDEKEGRDG